MKSDTKKTLLFQRQLVMFLVLSLFGLPTGVYGQKTVRFGGILAGQVIDVSNLTYQTSASTGRFLFGPTVEVRLPHHLSIEVNGLYQTHFYYQDFSYSFSSNVGDHTGSVHIDKYSWEVPTILQWHGLERHRNVFFGGGASFRAVYGPYQVSSTLERYCFAPNCKSQTIQNADPLDYDQTSHQTFGGVINGGLEFHTGVLYWRPQIRYVRWMDSIRELHTSKDSVQALLGISFGK